MTDELVGPGIKLYNQPPRRYAKVKNLAKDSGGDAIEAHVLEFDDDLVLDDANVVTSIAADNHFTIDHPTGRRVVTHLPVIDLDFPVGIRESSPGRYHLYLQRETSWEDFLSVLQAMADVGWVEPGYVHASMEGG